MHKALVALLAAGVAAIPSGLESECDFVELEAGSSFGIGGPRSSYADGSIKCRPVYPNVWERTPKHSFPLF